MPEESLESQNKFRDYKNEGLYAPLAPSGGAGAAPVNTGRPPGISTPQQGRTPSPKGDNKKAPAIASYSVKNISKAFQEYEVLTARVEEFLKKKHKKKSLNNQQKIIAEDLSKIIFINEKKDNWNSCIENYISGNTKENPEELEKIKTISEEHQIDLFSAAILNFSQNLK